MFAGAHTSMPMSDYAWTAVSAAEVVEGGQLSMNYGIDAKCA